MNNKLVTSNKTNIPEALERLIGIIINDNPMHKNFITSSIKNLTTQELEDLGTYINYCIKKGKSISYLAECYLTIVEDTFREQIYFTKHKKYRYSTFDEVANSVYFNNEYMERYMYGLALTSFLWLNHVKISRFFNEVIPKNKKGKYLEIGPGHGYYLMKAMNCTLFDSFIGIDISEVSIKQTNSIISHLCPTLKPKLSLFLNDFLATTDLHPNSFDSIIMGEVLEHVETPTLFLERIYELAKSDAFIFVTTCINAPAIDHIYLWRNIEELESMLIGAGFRISTSLYLPYEGKTIEKSLDKGLAINVGYVLEKI